MIFIPLIKFNFFYLFFYFFGPGTSSFSFFLFGTSAVICNDLANYHSNHFKLIFKEIICLKNQLLEIEGSNKMQNMIVIFVALLSQLADCNTKILVIFILSFNFFQDL